MGILSTCITLRAFRTSISLVVHIIDHPLVQDALMELRDVRTQPPEFRRAANRISVLLAAEALKDVPSRRHTVETPLGPADGLVVSGDVVVVPVLRAGLGMLDAVLELLPGRASATSGCSATRQPPLPRSTTRNSLPTSPTASC